jgi:superfamily II DNA or RNA helicase
MQAPTGFGKTLLAAYLVQRAREKQRRLLFTVPAIALVDQTVEMFYAQGIYDIGVIQANHHMTDWSKPVQIASVQTLMRREMPDSEIVLIDECHRWSRLYEEWLHKERVGRRVFIGLSATPWTKGLGAYYDKLVIAGTTQGLIAEGLLSDFKVFAASHPDLTGVRTVAGDYHEGELSARMSEQKLVGDVVETWKAQADGRPTLCYGVDRLHAKHLQQQFADAGISCAYQDAFTPDGERRAIKLDFHNGNVKVVVNVGTLTTGVDWDVRCISLVRPTKSEMLFVQIIGRGLRTAEGKDHCLVLDHSDNHLRLGFVTDIDAQHQELHQGKVQVAAKTENIRLPKECPQCHGLKPAGKATCPHCGFVKEAHSRIEPTAGELKEMDRAKKANANEIDKREFLSELKCYAFEHGYKPGWPAVKYKDRFGNWPERSMEDIAPALSVSRATKSWITSRNIAWIKAKQKSEMRS